MRVKSTLVFIIIAVFAAVSFAQAPTAAQSELAKYIRDNYDKQEVMITMRDGVRLFTSIYTPEKKSQKYPILLNRTPYTVKLATAAAFQKATQRVYRGGKYLSAIILPITKK